MFDYKSEAIAWSITAENAELREQQAKEELSAYRVTCENLESALGVARQQNMLAMEDAMRGEP